jgi:hypothetical protein
VRVACKNPTPSLRVMRVKIFALVSFRNESKYLPIFLPVLSKYCDGLIGYDDASEDNSRAEFMRFGGILLDATFTSSGRGATIEIRQSLLDLGRKLGGTHFVVADCDEIFAVESDIDLKRMIQNLKPRQRIALSLINIWGDENHYCQHPDSLAPRLMDFAFCDSPDTQYVSSSNFVHFKRTPRPSEGFGAQFCLPIDKAAVLHLSSLNMDSYQLKQAWYRVSERFYLGRSSRVINLTYKHTLPRAPITAPTLPFWKNTLETYSYQIDDIRLQNNSASWHFKSIKEMFDSSGIKHFLNLDIWHIPELRDLYVDRMGEFPVPSHGSEQVEKFIDRIKYLRFQIKRKTLLKSLVSKVLK